jgi:hypothetical protein
MRVLGKKRWNGITVLGIALKATVSSRHRHDTLPYSITRPSPSEFADLAAALLVAEGADPPTDPSLAPILVAGREGDNGRTDGLAAAFRPTSTAADCADLTTGMAGPAVAAAARAGARPGSGFASVFGSGSVRAGSGAAWARSGGGGSSSRGGGSSTARFSHITYMLVDATGRLIVVEREPHDGTAVRRCGPGESRSRTAGAARWARHA